jgi:hypothetical protein
MVRGTDAAQDSSATSGEAWREAVRAIADELELEASAYEGDFADTVNGCADALHKLASASPAHTTASNVKLPTMRAAFRTTNSSGAQDLRAYQMVFTFPSLAALHKADDEWRANQPTAQPATTARASGDERATRIGRHVLDFAKRGGWPDDGEGAFEFIQRHSYVIGYQDAGGKVSYGGTDTKGSRWPISAFASAPAQHVVAVDEKHQAHVMPPTRGTEGQLDAIVSTLPIEKIVQLMDENTDRHFGLKCEPFARAVEVEAIRRFRAQETK